jgi:MFS family permease
MRIPWARKPSPETSLWSIPAWRYSFPASIISRLGDVIFDLTIVLWIGTDLAAGESWAPAAVSGVLLAAAVPILVAGPIAGVTADRHDRHRIMVVSNGVQAVAISTLVFLPFLERHVGIGLTLAWIYAAILVSNAAGQFFNQGRLAMIAKTVPEEQRTSAFSAQGAANSLIALVGPPLAAPLLYSVGASWALGINALSFVVSSFLLRFARWDSRPEPSAEKESFTESLRGGVRAIVSNKMLLAITVAITAVTLASGAISVLEVFFIEQVLRVDPAMLGVMSMAFALGTLLGVAVAPRLEHRIDAAILFAGGLVAMGFLVVVYSRLVDFWPALVVFFAAAIPLGIVNTVLTPLAIRTIPADYLGRATVTLNVFPAISSLLAMACTGWLVSTVLQGLDVEALGTHFGPVDTVFLVGGLVMTVTGLAVARPLARSRSSRPAEPDEPDVALGGPEVAETV